MHLTDLGTLIFHVRLLGDGREARSIIGAVFVGKSMSEIPAVAWTWSGQLVKDLSLTDSYFSEMP